MSLATANRTGLKRVRETVWGTTPATPALIETRYTGESLTDSISTEKSAEIRSDRMVTDLALVDSSPGGSFNIEASFETYDDMLEAALMGTWVDTPVVGVGGDIETLAQPTDNLESSLAGKFTNIVVGQTIALTGFTNPLLNRTYYVSGKTSNQLLTLVPAPVAAETPAGAAANITGSYLRNGITERSYTVVKEFNDTTVLTRQIFRGMRVSGFSLDMQTAQLLTGVFNMMGKSAEFVEALFGGETTVPASTTEVMNSVTNLVEIFQNNAVIGANGTVMTLGVELDNQHREQKGLGVLGNIGVAAGTLMVNMSASQYFESKAQADLFKNSTAFSFSIQLRDNAGNAYVFRFPRCKYEQFEVTSSGLDTDVMAETQFTALRDPTLGCMIHIDRLAV